jgi:hypothetical protein
MLLNYSRLRFAGTPFYVHDRAVLNHMQFRSEVKEFIREMTTLQLKERHNHRAGNQYLMTRGMKTVSRVDQSAQCLATG